MLHATRCVLRPVDASKCVCRRGLSGGAYSAPGLPRPPRWFQGNVEGGMERVTQGQGTGDGGKDRREGREIELGGVRHWLWGDRRPFLFVLMHDLRTIIGRCSAIG